MYPNSLKLNPCLHSRTGYIAHSPRFHRLFIQLTVLALLFCPPLVSAYAAAVIDDTGASVKLSAPAQRIVSLAPHATELIFAAGAGDAVVGVAEFSNYPPEAASLQLIGNSSNLNLESIVGLQPDLIIAWKSGNTGGQVEQLARMGLPVFFSEPRRLVDIPANIERIGQLAGTQDTANRTAKQFRDDLRKLQQTYAERTPVKVFYEIWPQPLMTVNGEHLISQIIELCGGVNIFHALPTLAPVVNFESVLTANPEVIISASSAEPKADWYRKWLHWTQISAVKNRQFYYIEPDTIQRQSPRILNGARQLCKHLEQQRQTVSPVAPP